MSAFFIRRVDHNRAQAAEMPGSKPKFSFSDGDCRLLFKADDRGSMVNVIAASCSFFVPGLGQLLQGRVLMGLAQFMLAGMLWLVLLGWAIHLWSVIDAARFKPRAWRSP